MTGKIGQGAAYPDTDLTPGPDLYGEPIAPGFESVFRGLLLHHEQSDFQRVEVFQHAHFGRMLVLDGLIQTTELDEFCYHEMLVHPVLSSLDRVERVLVIGGGDGGALRHVLMHDPRQAVMCEIDEAVVRACREHMPGLAAGAFEDPRAELVIDDGFAFLAREDDAWDAIIIDSTDPIGAATVLFSVEFYEACRKALRRGGMLVTQSGSPLYQLRELRGALANVRAVFPTIDVYLGSVPTYPGVVWSYTAASLGDGPSRATAAQVEARLRARSVSTRYYTPKLHEGAFNLPAFVAEEVAAAGARTESAPVS